VTDVQTVEPTETPAEGTGTTRRGRPRPQIVIDRDEQVFQALTDPMTRAQLATASGVPENKVYLSMFRLRDAGRIKRERQSGNHVWSRTEETAPVA
jgi:Sugar-specific transcriptional regulator TrmB